MKPDTKTVVNKPAPSTEDQQEPEDITTGKEPSPKVEKEPDTYLDNLYSGSETRELSSTQQALDEDDTEEAASAAPVCVVDPVAESTRSTDFASEPAFDRESTTPSSLYQEFSDVAGEDYPESGFNYDPYYTGIYNRRAHLQGRLACTEMKTNVKRCRKPNRWIRTGECSWKCGRKGQGSRHGQPSKSGKPVKNASPKKKSAAATPSTKLQNAVGRKVLRLQQEIEELVHFVKSQKQRPAKKQKIVGRRQDIVLGNATDTTPAASLDMFVIYLERLQTKVIECIRAVVDAPAMATELDVVDVEDGGLSEFTISGLEQEATIVKRVKRQLVTPDMNPFTDNEDGSRDQDDTLGAAEFLFPDVESNSLHTGFEEEEAGPGFGWGTVYDHLATEGSAKDTTEEGEVMDEWLDDVKKGGKGSKAIGEGSGKVEVVDDGNDSEIADDEVDDADGENENEGGNDGEGLEASESEDNTKETTKTTTSHDTVGAWANDKLATHDFNIDSTADAATNSTSNSITTNTTTLGDWAQAKLETQNANTPPEDAASAIPYILAPGPVLPEGVKVNWPGPDNPGEGN